MTQFLLNKVLLVTFIMCMLNCLTHLWNVINNLREEVPKKYEITNRERFLLGISISYIITTIFTGIQI